MHTKSNSDYLQPLILGKLCPITPLSIPPPHTQYMITFSSGIIFEANPRHYIISSVNISLHISKR